MVQWDWDGLSLQRHAVRRGAVSSSLRFLQREHRIRHADGVQDSLLHDLEIGIV